jgi:hypothetical protein
MRLATFEINNRHRMGIVADADPTLLIDVSAANGNPSDLMPIVTGGDSMRHSLERLIDRLGRLSNRVRQRT